MKPVRVLAVVSTCAALVVSCGSQPESQQSEPATTTISNPYEDDRRAGVEELLARWAEAVRANDADALASLTDPRADPDFLPGELRRADALGGVPLSDWGFELVDEPEIPVPSAVASPLDAADVWAPSVVLRYAVDGPDTESTRRPVALLVARRDDRWRIVSDEQVPGIDRRTWHGPWDFGPVTARSVPTVGGTSVVLGHPDQASLVDELAAELPSAVEAVSDFYGTDWPRTALVFTTGSEAEFAESAGAEQAATGVAAVTISDAVEPDRPISGQRIVFGPAAPERLSEFTARSVLRHELTHVAARGATVDGSPMWLLEGFADYAGYRGAEVGFDRLAPTLAGIVRTGGAPTVLPMDSDFFAGGTRSTLAYESAWSVCAFVAQRFGEPALLALYADLATGPKSADDLDRAMTATLGVGTQEFLGEWGAWVVQQSG